MAIRLESEIGGKVVPLWYEIQWVRCEKRNYGDGRMTRMATVWSIAQEVSNAAPLRLIAEHGDSYHELQDALANAGFKRVETIVLPPKPAERPEKDMTAEELAGL